MFPANRSSSARARSSQPSHSAEEISGNEDLITEILLHLPIKSIIRFETVSKQWFSLISDHRFSLLHSNRNPCRTSGLFLDLRPSRQYFVDLDLTSSYSSKPPFKALGFRVVQSCNGLLLCSTSKNVKRRQSFVYNPTLKRFSSKLPPISGSMSGLGLAFEPSKSPHYKVVCVMADPFQIAIYSSEKDDWRTIDNALGDERMEIEFDNGVYWNGSLHWVGIWDISLRFNVDDETTSSFPMPLVPENCGFQRSYRYFGESRGHLHLVRKLDGLQSPRFDIHGMELDYSGWTVKFRVDLSQIPGSFPQILRANTYDYAFSVLCVVRGGDDIDDYGCSYLVLQVPGKILRYNLKTETFFKLCDFESGSRGSLLKWTDVHQFIESLASV